MDVVQRAAERWCGLLPGADVEPLLVVGRVQRLWALWDTRLRPTFAEAGLHAGDFDALAALRRADAPTAPAELAQAMLVTAGATTKRVDRLVAGGLAERVGGGTDGRRRLVRLTPDGSRLAELLMAQHLLIQAQLLATLTADERRHLEALLAKLLVATDRTEQAPPADQA